MLSVWCNSDTSVMSACYQCDVSMLSVCCQWCGIRRHANVCKKRPGENGQYVAGAEAWISCNLQTSRNFYKGFFEISQHYVQKIWYKLSFSVQGKWNGTSFHWQDCGSDKGVLAQEGMWNRLIHNLSCVFRLNRVCRAGSELPPHHHITTLCCATTLPKLCSATSLHEFVVPPH